MPESIPVSEYFRRLRQLYPNIVSVERTPVSEDYNCITVLGGGLSARYPIPISHDLTVDWKGLDVYPPKHLVKPPEWVKVGGFVMYIANTSSYWNVGVFNGYHGGLYCFRLGTCNAIAIAPLDPKLMNKDWYLSDKAIVSKDAPKYMVDCAERSGAILTESINWEGYFTGRGL